MKRLLIAFALIGLITSCQKDAKTAKVTQTDDYDQYLNLAERPNYQAALKEREFWSKRLRPDSSGVGDLGPLAGAYTKLFEYTGNSQHLYDAEKIYEKAVEVSTNNKDVYVRGLARNYITQHRFREAKEILERSYEGVSSKRATELMLFDVNMELGLYGEAEQILLKVKNMSDYNYLIRQAKWSDYKGDLDSAIKYLEKAEDIAESRNSKSLKIWTYSNLADFYGHAGRIADAYQGYLKTLQLDPENSYALKGIAWIVYSSERDSEESLRILEMIKSSHALPDYDLLSAEIAEWAEDSEKAEEFEKRALKNIRQGNYRDLYNVPLIELLAESDPSEALRIAQKEVSDRPTPQSYSLLAYAQLMNGDAETAKQIIEDKVNGKTFEPMAAYYSGLVYKALNDADKVENFKDELLEAEFEIGPLLTSEVRSW